MGKIYRKVFNIQYNNQIFTIFLDETNRRTFLKVNENGTYSYPLLEDFSYLNDFYNNINPFILDAKKYTFKEMVKTVTVASLGSLLTLTAIYSPKSPLHHYTVKISNNVLLVTDRNQSDKELIEIEDVSQFDEILGYNEISLEEIHRAIDNNDKIPLEFKGKVHLFLIALANKYPTIDLRIFYENIKTLEIVLVDDDYFINLGASGVGGRYMSEFNQMLVFQDVDDDLFYHELSHVFDTYYREYEDKIIYKGPTNFGLSLYEAMTNVTASCITTPTSYDKYGAIVEYFRKNVQFDYETYNKKGISPLFKLLREKYPKVDIDYIICVLDTMKAKEAEGNYFYLDSSPDLLDELFKICKAELSQRTDNYYEPFSDFARVLYYTSDACTGEADIMYSYLEKYNALLRKKNCNIEYITKEDIIEKLSIYEDIDGFVYRKNEVLPLVDNYLKVEENGYYKYCIQVIDNVGNKVELSHDGYHILPKKNLLYYMELTGVENYEIIGASDYWKKLSTEYQTFTKPDFKEIPFFLNGDLLGNELISNLSIATGLNQDGSVGFVIKNNENQILYKSDDYLSYESNFVDFSKFIKRFNEEKFTSLELSNILNNYYLTEILKEDNFFSTVIIKDGNIQFIPSYKIIISANFQKYNYDLADCYFENRDDEFFLSPLQYTTGFDEKVYLKDILYYYNMLNPNQLEYEFTEDELREYYQNYINDISISKTSRSY